jgi:hypothetical protein
MVSAAAAVCLLFVIAYVGVTEWRWQRALSALHAEPGLHITAERSSWGTRELRGLRQATARDPAEVLRAFGIDPRTLILRFDAYVDSALTNSVPQARDVSLSSPP